MQGINKHRYLKREEGERDNLKATKMCYYQPYNQIFVNYIIIYEINQ